MEKVHYSLKLHTQENFLETFCVENFKSSEQSLNKNIKAKSNKFPGFAKNSFLPKVQNCILLISFSPTLNNNNLMQLRTLSR